MTKVWKKVLSSALALAMVASSFAAGGVTVLAASENLALGAEASVNDVEVDYWGADKTVDGIVNRDAEKPSQSRWSTNKGSDAKILTLNLGEVKTFNKIVIEWERENITGYTVKVSNDGETYKDAYTKTTAGYAPVTDTVYLETPASGQYVQLVVDGYDGGTINWASVSLYEFSLYLVDESEIPEQPEYTLTDVVNMLEVADVEDGKWALPEVPEGFEIEFIGADYEQILDRDLTVYQPLVDTTVSVNFRVSYGDQSKDTAAYTVAVPGKYAVEEGDNAKPVVIPEMAEWKGHTGEFAITDDSVLYVNPEYKDALAFTAESFAADYEEVTGNAIEIVYGTDAKEGDFYFTLGSKDAGLKEEGYIMTIADYVTVEALDATGAFWAVQSIMQILELEDGTIAKGIARDYPKFEVRGFMLDVGRKTFEMDYLYDSLKQMAYYKMNDFQIHLNDNYIFLEEYTSAGEDPMTAYSGFRLESDVKEGGNNGLNKADLTSKDVFYTKDEFRTFIQTAREMGVDVVPEFDTPAHSLAFTKVRPDLKLGNNGRQNDHFDITTEAALAESEEFIFDLWDEYLDGENPVFDKETIINVGTDEYSGYNEQFRKMTDDLLAYAQGKERKVRLWGSLSTKSGKTEVRSEGVQMNIWNTGWANPEVMYKEGYDLINMVDGTLYIVPAAGYYHDYLNGKSLYNNWVPNKMGNMTIPAGAKQMLGAAYAIWNDMIDKKANGLCEYDIYDRFDGALPAMSSKLWGDGTDLTYDEVAEAAEILGQAPGNNARGEVETKTGSVLEYTFEKENLKDTSGNRYHGAEGENTAFVETEAGKALQLNGGTSYVTTALENIGPGAEITVTVKADADGEGEQILFEDGHTTVKMAQAETGKVGFSREGYDYSFNYELPKDEWVTLTFKTFMNSTELYVNGELEDTLGKGMTGDLYATCMFPLAVIGSETDSFKGLVEDFAINVTVEVDDSATIIPSDGFKVTCDNQYGGTTTEGVIGLAFDGNTGTIWHSNYSPYQELPATVEIDMGQAYLINQFDYLPRQDGSKNGRILSYELYGKLKMTDDWTPLAEGSWASTTDIKKAYFDKGEYQYLKFVAVTGDGDSGKMFASAAEFYVHEYDAKADLKAVYTAVESFEEDDAALFTEASWNALMEAKAAALAVIENADATEEEIAAACEALQTAMDNLQDAEEEPDPTPTPTPDPWVNPFKDVAEGKWYYDAVAWGNQNGVVNGLKADVFGVKENCTRGQIVTFIWRAMGEPAAEAAAHNFTDVVEGKYYYDAMLWAVENGIVTGLTETTFGPEATCTRQEIATLLYRLAGEPEVGTEIPFSDIAEGKWYTNAVIWAAEDGVVTGYDNGTFGRKDNVSREQTVTMLYRYFAE